MSLRRLGLLLALPTVVGLSLAACGTEDDAAPPPPSGGSGTTAGTGGTAGSSGGGKGGTGAEAGMINPEEGGMGGQSGPGPSEGGSGGDTAAQGGAGGDGPPPNAGDGNTAAGAGGEGGQAPVACRTDLQSFTTNPGGAMGIYLGPAAGQPGAQTGPVTTSTVVYNSTEGATAAGSGQLNANFSAFGDYAQLGLFYSNTSWTCHSKLHAMVKLVTSATDLSYIAGIEFSLSSNNYAIYTPQLNSTAGFPLNTWKPIVLDFSTATPAPKFSDVSGIGIQLKTVTSGTTPVTTTMYVDDVWVE
jgi:hypothetical protein